MIHRLTFGFPGNFFCCPFPFVDLDVGELGQTSDCFREIAAFMPHYPAEDIAMLATTETVVCLFRRTDNERASLFVVERTAADHIRALVLQRNCAPNELNDIGSFSDSVNVCL